MIDIKIIILAIIIYYVNIYIEGVKISLKGGRVHEKKK